jgi:hypothetical protein
MEFLLSLALLVGTEPTELVKQLMREEVAMILAPGTIDPFGEEELLRLYTRDLALAYVDVMERQAALNMPLLDGDPITGHQEYCPLRNITANETARSAEAAEVTVTFESQWCFADAPAQIRGEVTTIVFALVTEGGEWRIADFNHSAYGSFHALLAELMLQR